MLAEVLESQGLEMSATYFIYAILDYLTSVTLKQKDVASTSSKPSSQRFPIMVSSLTIQTRTVPHSLHLFEQSWDCAMFLSSGSRKVFAISTFWPNS